jgi:hypothetical protein
VWTPSPIEGADSFAEQIYAPQAVASARDLYRRYDAIAAAASTPPEAARHSTVEKAFRDALDLARDTLRAGLTRKPPPAYAVPAGYALEDAAPQLAIHIAFILAANDHDHAGFRRRVAQALESSAPGSLVERLSTSGFAPATVAGLRGSNPSQGFIRAMALYFLIDGRRDAAERAMRALIHWHADLTGRTYYYPADPAAMRRESLDPEKRLEQIVSAPPQVERIDHCSDLYAIYVEWLDLQSQVAVRGGPPAQRQRVLGDIRRFRSATPAPLIGPKYAAALEAAAARLSRRP